MTVSHATARLLTCFASVCMLASGSVFAAKLPVSSDTLAAVPLRTPNDAVYVLVELNAVPTAAQYSTQLGVSKSVTLATSAAVGHLAAVQSEQATFASGLAKAGLPGMTEIYRLQRVYNGILYQTPRAHLAALRAMAGVKGVHIVTPKVADNAQAIPFVNVPALWMNAGLPVHGEGIRIGVIDTGIDYTHANFGGTGTVAAYTSNDPNVVEPGTFPTAKVVGGWDFAGHIYDAASTDPRKVTPMPDADPLDGSGHGSHVAGTVAGFGENPNGTTYTGTYDQSFAPSTFRIGPGAAPKALLYALKVFGDGGGSTNLAALALEWAVDPNGDGNFSDHLDVVNLSLGSTYGTSDDSEAGIYTNAVRAGVVVVAAAGNSSDVYFITGAPATTPEVISVAATSIGEYSALKVNTPVSLAGFKAQSGSSPQIPASALTGNLVAMTPALGCTAPTNGAALKGNIAFVQRGTCAFSTKVNNAQAAGAVGIIVYNSAAGGDTLITMSLDGTATIPARIIGLTDGTAINTALSGAVNVTVDDAYTMTKPAEQDSVANFSSRGPTRNRVQAVLKPDVAAPGVNIVSTAMGTGNGYVGFSGTSMATPLTAGTVALLRQLHPTWSPAQIKALLMNTANHETYNLPVGATGRTRLSPTRQGAGRIDGANALGTSVRQGQPRPRERVVRHRRRRDAHDRGADHRAGEHRSGRHHL
jgi:subtilisin family serine protease